MKPTLDGTPPRRWLVAFAGIAVAFAAVGTAYADSPHAESGQPAHHRVPPANGAQIGHDPTLKPGREIELAVPGFAAGAPVQLRIACMPPLPGKPKAGRDGVLHLTFRVPSTLPDGHYVLTFVGPGRATGRPAAGGSVIATVPAVAFFPVEVDDSGPHVSQDGEPKCP
ncbi:MAG: hypothetical protein JWO57_270 [Pseudonocardiales bacterium]|nr:hypothetical protein [Pseudonocardiales bacterium]